ncbi:MAG: class I tRNA ligase family protein [Candidatus Gracilibacteria bacterium]|nr:class I tRNA ligase family protein [Candidatus Gracilibacteria bacterium]
MILVNNGLPNDLELQREWRKNLLILLNPFAPHLAEELWERMNKQKVESIHFESWPKFDENMVVDDEVTIAVQVLGKVRGQLNISVNENKDVILAKARELESVKKWLDGKEIVKEIYVTGKIVNIVIK